MQTGYSSHNTRNSHISIMHCFVPAIHPQHKHKNVIDDCGRKGAPSMGNQRNTSIITPKASCHLGTQELLPHAMIGREATFSAQKQHIPS
jgi:hypothetical protein